MSQMAHLIIIIINNIIATKRHLKSKEQWKKNQKTKFQNQIWLHLIFTFENIQ